MLEIQRNLFKILHIRINSPTLPFLQVLIGPRQVGKTTLIRQIAAEWSGSKLIETADGLTPPKTEWLEFLWNKANEQHGQCLLAIDEIQKIKNWSAAIKILFDRDRHKNKLRVILTGSASLELQQGLNESLAGRYELLRCPHWGLDECKKAFDWSLSTYLKFGGYPSPAFMIDQVDRWQAFVRDGILEPVLGRDLQSAVSIQKPALLRQLLALAMHYPAQEISYQKLLGQLQDEGNTATLKHYLDILKGGFLLTTLEKYSGSIVRQKSSSPKLLPLAPALIHAYSSPNKIDNESDWRGRVFEAAIGAHLFRLGLDLSYWREGDQEVDFVLSKGEALYAIEVKSGRRRRSQGLLSFKTKFPAAETLLLDWEHGENFLAQEPKLQILFPQAEV